MVKRSWLLSAASILIVVTQPVPNVTADDMAMDNRFYELRWDADRKKITIAAPDHLPGCMADLSLAGRVTNVGQSREKLPQLGAATRWEFGHQDGSTTVVLLDDWPLIGVRRSVKNATGEVRSIDKQPVMEARLELGAPADQLVARGTAGLYPLGQNLGSYVFAAVADPASSVGIVFGWASNVRGQGVVFPRLDAGSASVQARVDYGDLLLRDSESERGELLLIGLFADVRGGLEQYAEATASHLDIQLRPLPGVYCTWYHAGASDEKRLARNTDFAAQKLRPWGLSVMQIDDKWQPGLSVNGPKRIFATHDPQGPYPNGMKATADYIRSREMVPGIWFMPFSGTWLDPYFADKQDIFYKVGAGDPAWTQKEMAKQDYQPDRPMAELPYSTHWAGTSIDCSHPKSQQYLREVVHRMSHEWGYKYFKMDGLHCGTGSRQRYIDNEYQEDDLGRTTRFNRALTPIESYHLGLQIIREAAGEDVFFLGCCQVQNLRSFGTTFGLLDAMRVGPDNGPRWANADRGPRYGGRYYFLNKRVWHCDPDPFYVRSQLSYKQATTLASWIALAGQLTASSYDYYELPPERLDIIRRVLPTHALKTSRPLDFLQRDVPHQWLLTDDASGVRRTVLGHFNWATDEAITLTSPLSDLGLKAGDSYVGFDYWGDQFVAGNEPAIEHHLPAGSCKVISVYPAKQRPQLVSTSRHVTQGVVDVVEEMWDAEKLTLAGTSRVVAGDLYELRIALPADAAWRVVDVQATDADDLESDVATRPLGVRVRVTPKRNGTLTWKVRFARDD